MARLSTLSPATRREAIRLLADAVDPGLILSFAHDWQFLARDDQLPPVATAAGTAWRTWAFLGGRGSGKTRAGAEWVRAVALGLWSGEPAARRIALVGPTQAHVRAVMVDGVSGLMSVHPPRERPALEVTRGQLVWPNGAIAQFYSAEDPEGFVGASLDAAGLIGTGSLAARSYLAWGVANEQPAPGAITVLSRGADPALGHVGFLVGTTGDKVVLLGGNQSDAVSVATFDRNRVLGFRLPGPSSVGSAMPPASSDKAEATTVGHTPADDTVFAAALAHVLAFEGGWSDDPFDPGGPTNKGITLATLAHERAIPLDAQSYPALKAELRAIPEREVHRIYLERYWRAARCPDLPAPLAVFHFDAAVNQGVPTAARMLQEALGAAVDGAIGPATLAAARASDPDQIIARYADIRRRRYRALGHFWRFGRGWLRRVDATAKAAGNLVHRPTSPATTEPTEPLHMPEPYSEMPPAQTAAQSPAPTTPTATAKWWGESLTIWGVVLTALTTVAPALFAAAGIDMPATLIERLGRDILAVVQAVGGLVGTVITVAGRIRARGPLERRIMAVRI